MADNWDDDDFEPEVKPAAAVKVSDRWDGEDEDDDDVKDDWDADSEEEKPKEEVQTIVKVKKKKTLAQKIAEKEEKAEQEKLAQLQEEAEAKALETPEGKLAEKLRAQKLIEDNDLKLALELMGDGSQGGVIDGMVPESKEEFEKFAQLVVDKFSSLESSEHYQDFAENFVKTLCMSMTVPTLKKVKGHVEAFHSTKLKEQKAGAAKAKAGKPATKTSLKFDTNKSLMSGNVDGGFGDDMDDFM